MVFIVPVKTGFLRNKVNWTKQERAVKKGPLAGKESMPDFSGYRNYPCTEKSGATERVEINRVRFYSLGGR